MTNRSLSTPSLRFCVRMSLVAAVAVGAAAACSSVPSDLSTPTTTTSPTVVAEVDTPVETAARGGLTEFIVDYALAVPDHPDRGVLTFEDGTTETVVVDQLAVIATDAASLDAFVGRWPLEIVEQDSPAADGSVEALVALAADADVNTESLPGDLGVLQPSLRGTVAASDRRLVQLYTIVTAEGVRGDVVVVPNDIVLGDDDGPWEPIEDRNSTEGNPSTADNLATSLGPNPFEWTYLADGTTQDFGVVGAWTILEGTNRFERRVNIVVQDGGFVPSFDYGGAPEIRHGTWGEQNRTGCGDNPCPWHGTGVAQTALGHIDDWTGVVGTAGPIGRLFAIESSSPTSWKQLRNLRNVALDDEAHVVNMSWGSQSTTVPGIRTAYYDHYFKRIQKSNVLLVAAAGNDGRNVDAGNCGDGCDETRLFMPCESSYVLCVGGVAHDSVKRADLSNFGTEDNDSSVEIYGPMRVMVSTVDTSSGHAVLGDNILTSGTSFSSPFVAGIGALLFAADGDMTSQRAARLLADTARQAVTDANIRSGSRRLVNAREAVLELLGIELAAPTVSFTTPTDADTIAPDGLLEIRLVATDNFGNPLWADVEAAGVDLGRVRPGGFVAATLPPGQHDITATATDRFGQTATVTISVAVPAVPATLEIVGVADGETLDGGTELTLLGRGRDGVMFQSIPTNGLAWGLIGTDGSLIAIDEGEQAKFQLPNEAGEYSIVLDSNDVIADEVVVSFRIRQTDPNFTPQVRIYSPDDGEWFSVNGAFKADIAFAGRAFNTNGAPIAPQRLRWTATASDGEHRTLCEGTSFSNNNDTDSGNVGEKISIADNDGSENIDDFASADVGCGSGTARLSTVQTSGENTWWRLTLEVIEPTTGAIASNSTVIYLEYIAS